MATKEITDERLLDKFYLQRLAADKQIEVWWNDLEKHPNHEVNLCWRSSIEDPGWREGCDTARTAIEILEGRHHFG